VFASKGGDRILTLYEENLCAVLKGVYPDYEWLPWKFKSVPKHFWTTEKNRFDFFRWIESDMQLKELGC
jgi:hypothetical protein